MTRHYPDLGNASDWLNQISHAARPIRSTTQIWVVTRHQYGISALVSQTSFGGKTSGSVAKCRLFSQAISATIQVKATEQYFPVAFFIIYGGGAFKNSLSHLKMAYLILTFQGLLTLATIITKTADHTPVSYISRMGDWYGYQFTF